jgi:hypothetical protein
LTSNLGPFSNFAKNIANKLQFQDRNGVPTRFLGKNSGAHMQIMQYAGNESAGRSTNKITQ